MNSTLITNQQVVATKATGIGNSNTESGAGTSAVQFINLLQQKLGNKPSVNDASESDSSDENLIDTTESQDSKDTLIDQQTEEDREKKENDEMSSRNLSAVNSVIQEEPNLRLIPKNAMEAKTVKTTDFQAEQVNGFGLVGDEETSSFSNVVSASEDDSASNKVTKKDMDMMNLNSNSIVGNQQELGINLLVNNLSINDEQSNVQNEVKSISVQNLDGIENVQGIVSKMKNSDDDMSNFSLTDMLGNQDTNLVMQNKFTSGSKGTAEIMTEVSSAITAKTDTKENSVPTVKMDAKKKLATVAKTDTEGKLTSAGEIIENVTQSQTATANLMMENKIVTDNKPDFTAKISNSETVLQSKTATSIVKTLLSGESKQVTVQLEPGSLGKIEISLQSTSNEVSLNFKLSSSHAKSLISSISTQLEQVLNNQIAADKPADDKITAYQTTPTGILDGAQFSFGQHQFGQQANQNMSKSIVSEQYRNNKIGQDETIIKEQEKEQQSEKNIISILA
ncbi:flagellar hook-length control protein FliK [Liquorilactobacillus mali]|uniref:Flagellar hook-length control protein FliK n=1 Tax=Liquorilactobacillus mali KCTC 3596 = DSM 20444 TaxID=1046596 RepID=J0L8G9_9LACO|nr:flagellar hook-length control protein FliK [Liquorilactobacillus mali]AJA34109.1 flagellar hook-length control protein FliK [Liquorilactobacillus mali KCTC 3596 = DSM 20444]EJF02200.1 flagellar hook-length control protein FliK [Liquorilactobacillus mali KCTC 3596 = DSM 20444]KRN11132.1 flagellar hook-length control protein FliK [Liquorilactobacillus mali KCTC 3596 = DSM 20444]QFQ75627.1 flagellar hook-length control protein FliK [Liquorilactobacillus mali]